MEQISFKERVRKEIIDAASNYKNTFIDFTYLICSDIFQFKNFYIIDAQEDNFQHLTGVNSLISAKEFFRKSLDKSLSLDDFNFIKRGMTEKDIKGSVRRKIKVLNNINNVISNPFAIQEKFTQNKVICTIAASDNSCTLGFIGEDKSYPKSLLFGNQLDVSKSGQVDLILKRNKAEEKFSEIVFGELDSLKKHFNKIEEHVSIDIRYKII